MKIEVYQYGIIRKQYGWRLRAQNGRIIAHGKGFNTKQALKKSLFLVKSAFQDISNPYINDCVDNR